MRCAARSLSWLVSAQACHVEASWLRFNLFGRSFVGKAPRHSVIHFRNVPLHFYYPNLSEFSSGIGKHSQVEQVFLCPFRNYA